jgi:hypothetical protein
VSVTSLKATFTEEQKLAMVRELQGLARALGNPMGEWSKS